MTLAGRVSPFGHPRIKAPLPAPRGLTQACTSFIACDRQGIHHMHLLSLDPITLSTALRVIEFQVFAVPSAFTLETIDTIKPDSSMTSSATTNLYFFLIVKEQPISAQRAEDRAQQRFFLSSVLCLLTFDWWSWTGSNRRPPACKAGALPAELQPRVPGVGGSGWVRTIDPRLIKTVL